MGNIIQTEFRVDFEKLPQMYNIFLQMSQSL